MVVPWTLVLGQILQYCKDTISLCDSQYYIGVEPQGIIEQSSVPLYVQLINRTAEPENTQLEITLLLVLPFT